MRLLDCAFGTPNCRVEKGIAGGRGRGIKCRVANVNTGVLILTAILTFIPFLFRIAVAQRKAQIGILSRLTVSSNRHEGERLLVLPDALVFHTNLPGKKLKFPLWPPALSLVLLLAELLRHFVILEKLPLAMLSCLCRIESPNFIESTFNVDSLSNP